MLVPKRSGQPGLALRQRKVARPHDRYGTSATHHPGCPPGMKEGRRAGSAPWGAGAIPRPAAGCAAATRRVSVTRRAARLRAASKHRPLGPSGVFSSARWHTPTVGPVGHSRRPWPRRAAQALQRPGRRSLAAVLRLLLCRLLVARPSACCSHPASHRQSPGWLWPALRRRSRTTPSGRNSAAAH